MDGPRGDLPSCRPVLREAEQLRRRPFSAGSVSPLLPTNGAPTCCWQRAAVVLQIIGYIVSLSAAAGGNGGKRLLQFPERSPALLEQASLGKSPWLWENQQHPETDPALSWPTEQGALSGFLLSAAL